MKNQKSIQILRSSKTYNVNLSEEILLDGQPLYSKRNSQLYVGNGADKLSELKPVGAANLIANPSAVGAIQQLTYPDEAIDADISIRKNPLATGFGSVAFGGYAGDDPDGTPTEEDTTTTAEGIQAIAMGCGTHAYGNWDFVGGKDSKTYQQETFAFGGKCEAGMSEEEFNEYWSVIVEKDILNSTSEFEIKNATVYFKNNEFVEFSCSTFGTGFYKNVDNLSILANYWDYGEYELEVISKELVEINGELYAKFSFGSNYYIIDYDQMTGELRKITHAIADGTIATISSGSAYTYQKEPHKIPKYAGYATNFISYDSVNDIVTYSNGDTYSLEEAKQLPRKDASDRIWSRSYSFATAFGSTNKSKGRGSFTVGTNNTNYGQYSFIGGRLSTLSEEANQSFLFGFDCHSTAYDTVNIGDKNKVGAQYCVALGVLNEIPELKDGKYYQGSVLLGYGHKASRTYQTLVGRYSDSEGNIFAVGNGTRDNARSNIFAITSTGQAIISGAPSSDTHGVRLKELNNVLTTLTNRINTAVTDNNNKWTALKIKTSGNQGLIGGDYGNAAKSYVKSYGGIGLGIRPRIEEAATGGIGLGIDAEVTGYGGVAIGSSVKAGRYDFVAGTSCTSTQANGNWYNVVIGGNNSTDYASTTLIGKGHTATRNYQTLLGSWADTSKNPIFALGIGGLKGGVPTNAFEVLGDGRMKLYSTAAPTKADNDDVTTVGDVKNLMFIVDESFPNTLSEKTCKEIHERISKGMDTCIIRSPLGDKTNCTYGILKKYTRDVIYLDEGYTIVSKDSDDKYMIEYNYSLYLTIDGYNYWISFIYDEYVKDGNETLYILSALDRDYSGIESTIPNIKYLSTSPDNFDFTDSVTLGDIFNGVQDDGTIGNTPDIVVIRANGKLGVVSSHNDLEATAILGDYLYTFSVSGNLLENGEYYKKELLVNSTYLEEQLSNTLKYEHLFKFSLENNIPAGIYEAEVYASYIDSSETEIGVGATGIEKVTSVYNHLLSKYNGDIPASGYIVKNGETVEYYSVYKIGTLSSNGVSGMAISGINNNSKLTVGFMSSVLTSASVSETIREL